MLSIVYLFINVFCLNHIDNASEKMEPSRLSDMCTVLKVNENNCPKIRCP